MGAGTWTAKAFSDYSTTTRGCSLRDDGTIDIKGMSASQVYKQRNLAAELDPKGVIRECVDSKEHPNTIPVILALDVTGSMGEAAVEVAAELNKIMTKLYEDVTDVEFMVMGIGDFAYDHAPLQVSQFESDIRIAEQLDKIYFEFGGGGNDYESYTAAWAFADSQVKLDCWKRGEKGIIITMGDELLNPYIPIDRYNNFTNSGYQDLDTPALYDKIKDRYNVFHINVNHRTYGNEDNVNSFKKVLNNNVYDVPTNGVAQAIVDIVKRCNTGINKTPTITFAEEISWE